MYQSSFLCCSKCFLETDDCVLSYNVIETVGVLNELLNKLNFNIHTFNILAVIYRSLLMYFHMFMA